MRLQGKHTVMRKEFTSKNHSRSLPKDPDSPHAYSTPGVYTFSVTWIVLQLLTSLALGYGNRPDHKSTGSVAATRFIPRVLSFLCTLSDLERDAHRPNHLFIQPQTPLSPGDIISQLVTSHTQSHTTQLQLPTEI
jgi:hypothetical protein